MAQAKSKHVMVPKDLQLTEEQRREVTPEGFSQCVRVLRQNWRQGTVACKDRSEVAFANRKPWKQKGTGRARAGSARSPLWRTGGVTFGPQKREKKLAAPQKLRQQVYNNLLWHYLDAEKILRLDWAAQDTTPKTALAYRALKEAGIEDKKVLLFVTHDDRMTHLSFDNIPSVRMLLFDQANAYNLADGDYWVVLNKDMDAFKEMVQTWI